MCLNVSGKNIKRLRLAQGRSREELAERLTECGRQASPQWVGDVESGRCQVYDLDIVWLCRVLETPVSELFKD